MINKLKSYAIGLGLIAAFATQASAVIVDGDAYNLVTIKSTLTVVDGFKLKTVSFTNKDILAFAQAAKGAKLACEMPEEVEDTESYLYILTKDNAEELSLYNNPGDVYTYVYMNDSNPYIVKEGKNDSYSYKTTGGIGFYVYFYTGEDESDYTYIEFNSATDSSAKLTQSVTYSKTSTTYKQSLSDVGMVSDSRVQIADENSYPFVSGKGSLNVSGSAKFTEL